VKTYLFCEVTPCPDNTLIQIYSSFILNRLYWQNAIGLFNQSNPGGTVTQAHEYLVVLIIAVVVSFVASLKRLCVGLVLSRATYSKLLHG